MSNRREWRRSVNLRHTVMLGLLVVALVGVPAAQADEKPEKESFWSRFKDPEDGKLDVTAGSEEQSGFLPVIIPFNEPATGPGLLAAVGYFHPRKKSDIAESARTGQAVPPTTTFGAGGYAQNGTWVLA